LIRSFYTEKAELAENQPKVGEIPKDFSLQWKLLLFCCFQQMILHSFLSKKYLINFKN